MEEPPERRRGIFSNFPPTGSKLAFGLVKYFPLMGYVNLGLLQIFFSARLGF